MARWKWDPAQLRDRDRLALARVSGTAARYGYGNRKDAPRAEAVEALRAITTDPVVLGIAAASELYDPHGYGRRPAADLLREAGADWVVAEEHAAEMKAYFDRVGPGS